MTISSCGIDCSRCAFFTDKKCPGCRKAAPEGNCVWGGRCELYDCADSQKLPHCGKCAKFPCDKLKEWASGENPERIGNLIELNKAERKFDLTYSRLKSDSDEISTLITLHRLPEISRFISIDELNYFNYVTQTENVAYFLVHDNDLLIGTMHTELNDGVCEISLLVDPMHQRKGYAWQMLTDLLNGRIIGGFTAARAWIEEANIPSLRLFEKAGFSVRSQEDELVEMVCER